MKPNTPNIAEIRAMVAAATPGPWELTVIGEMHITKGYRVEDGLHRARWIADMACEEDNPSRDADAALIAKAPETISALCDEVERLQKENTLWTKQNKELVKRNVAYKERNERDQVEIERQEAEIFNARSLRDFAVKKANELSELLDSANNAIEPLNAELDYERRENKRLRNFMERIHAAFEGGVTDLEVARKMARLAGEALRRERDA